MPQLDLYTIFFEVFEFSFIFWCLYFFLLKNILPNIYKSIQIRNNKIFSLNLIITKKIPYLINVKNIEVSSLYEFFNILLVRLLRHNFLLIKIYNILLVKNYLKLKKNSILKTEFINHSVKRYNTLLRLNKNYITTS